MRDFVLVDDEWFNAGLYDKWSLVRDIPSAMYYIVDRKNIWHHNKYIVNQLV